MTTNDYQIAAARTLIASPERQWTGSECMTLWNALGLAGEAGEVADLVKKGICHDKGVDYEKVRKELGDVLWYVAALCTTLGMSLEQVMDENIAKLKARYPDGWDAARSHRPGELGAESEAR